MPGLQTIELQVMVLSNKIQKNKEASTVRWVNDMINNYILYTYSNYYLCANIEYKYIFTVIRNYTYKNTLKMELINQKYFKS